MSPEAIKEQLETIERVTNEIMKSKEVCLEFLTKAGIIDLLDDKEYPNEEQNVK
jgi:hypothetical protein